MSSIILVSAHIEDCPEAVPLGAASVAAALRQAFPHISIQLLETFTSIESAASENAASFVKKIQKTLTAGTIAIGFSVYSWNRALMLHAARILRAAHPQLFFFCGGPEVTALPEGLIAAEGGAFDAVIRGDGEIEAVRVLGEVLCTPRSGARQPKSAGGAVSVQPCRIDSLESLPSPWLDGTLDIGEHAVLWELSRGCPYACAYCYESKGAQGGKRVRYMSDERIRAELALFLQKKAPYVFVLDPTFNSDNERALNILDLIYSQTAASGAGTHWHFEVRSELLNRRQAHGFAKIGASVQIGLQTANPKAAALIGRGGFDSGFDAAKFRAKINLLNDAGVTFGLDLIYGLPGDTLDDYKKSVDYALSLYPNNLDMFRLSVLPGTALWDNAAELGLNACADSLRNNFHKRFFCR
ncbi:MAG: hypothetical protein Ta2A_15860 [Treponemataceae bacterium]|nr:MAG: hypothetical protein Ta2A_15860 [Treponemataceae bacterium]